MIRKKLERTRQQLIKEVATRQLSKKEKEVFIKLLKKMDMCKMYRKLIASDYSEEIQYQIAKYFKKEIPKLLPNADIVSVEETILEIAFNVIPA